ncbi:hypothetical protein [Pleomorphovibrio marinus]|uniref:hypothetical protein n=1 Tax=Pleomorphovibrio marinus TaxID=2164132 RepID=UPI000E09F901|nr:hypothetical protein [Pleomorphovibrio marinus]
MENTEKNELGNLKDLPSTKVSKNVNKRTQKILSEYGNLSSKVNLRLEELEKEWNLEKVLAVNASAAILSGMILGAASNKKWYILPTAVAGFLLQHGFEGWCAPASVFRLFGFRRKQEIEEERQSLMALRGDYDILAKEAEPTTTPSTPAE